MAQQIGTIPGLIVAALSVWLVVKCQGYRDANRAPAPQPANLVAVQGALPPQSTPAPTKAETAKPAPKKEPTEKEKAAAVAAEKVASAKARAAADKAESARLKELRLEFAKDLEIRFLKGGMSVDVITKGKDSTILHYKYALVSKAFAYQVSQNTEFLSAAKKLGFKRVVLTDGFDDTWNIDL